MTGRGASTWVLGGALVYALSLFLGLLSKAEATSLSLVWPAAGAATVWLLGAGRARAAVLLGLVLVTTVANVLSGVDALPSLLFGLLNTGHAVAAVAVLRLFGWRSARPPRAVADLGALVVASLAGSAVSAPCAALIGAVSFGTDLPQSLLLLAVRNSVSTLLVVPLLLALPALRDSRRAVSGRAGGLERWACTVLALLGCALVVRAEDLPLAFLVLAAAVWSGTRTGPAWTSVLLAGVSVEVVLHAVAGTGSLAATPTPAARVLLAQALLAVLVLVGLWLALADVERAEALQAAQQARDLLQENADAALVGQAALDLNGGRPTVSEANPALCALLRRTAEQLQGSDLLELVAPSSRPALRTAVQELCAGTRAAWHGDLVLVLGPAPQDRLDVEAALGAASGGRVTAQLLDVTARRRAEERLSHLALHDELTGLPNRTLWRDHASQALAAAQRSGARTGLLSVDLDRFKAVNDEHGHEVGDRLLVEVARRLRAAVRPGDTVARVGGDEFLVLCPGIPDERELEDVGRRLLAAVGPVVQVGRHRLPVTASVGSALPRTAEEAAALGVRGLLRQADGALLAAKRAGRSRLVAHDDRAPQDGEGLLPDLRRALAAGQLVAHYQPVVDLATGRTTGLEALVRWEHPHRGVLTPTQFLDVLEASDLIHPLGQLVLEQACRDAAALAADGEALPVHVNVSAQELDRPGLFVRVRSALASSGLPASLLVLELTETRLLAVEAGLLHELEAVRALGVRLAVDDFGTGYSALTHLVQMPVDVLKLDRSFVAGLVDNRSAQAVTSGVIAMARALDVECVAEGVETDAQARALLGLGYDVAQGWLWSRALPARALRPWLQAAGVPAQR